MAPLIMEVIYSDRTHYIQTKFGSPDGRMHIMESSQGSTPTAVVNEIAVLKEKRERDTHREKKDQTRKHYHLQTTCLSGGNTKRKFKKY